MELKYSLTQEDFLESLIFHRNPTAFLKWCLRLLAAIVFCSVAVYIFYITKRSTINTLSGAVPLLAMTLAWFWIFLAGPRRAARRQFRKQPAAQGSWTLLIDDSGVHARWEGGSSEVEWKNYIRWRESNNLILLYLSPVSWGIIPKRALDPPQLTELRALLEQNVKPLTRR
jgi:hypothetical protein